MYYNRLLLSSSPSRNRSRSPDTRRSQLGVSMRSEGLASPPRRTPPDTVSSAMQLSPSSPSRRSHVCASPSRLGTSSPHCRPLSSQRSHSPNRQRARNLSSPHSPSYRLSSANTTEKSEISLFSTSMSSTQMSAYDGSTSDVASMQKRIAKLEKELLKERSARALLESKLQIGDRGSEEFGKEGQNSPLSSSHRVLATPSQDKNNDLSFSSSNLDMYSLSNPFHQSIRTRYYRDELGRIYFKYDPIDGVPKRDGVFHERDHGQSYNIFTGL